MVFFLNPDMMLDRLLAGAARESRLIRLLFILSVGFLLLQLYCDILFAFFNSLERNMADSVV